MICILKTLRKIYKNGNKLFKQDSNFFKILGLKKDNKNMVKRLSLKLKNSKSHGTSYLCTQTVLIKTVSYSELFSEQV